MGVLLQAFYKKQPGKAVPSPVDGDPSVPFWWDRLGSEANELRKAGFTAVWLPPVLKTASGAGPDADGYGAFDDYDIGSRDQKGPKGTTFTRFGTREQLQRCVAILRANGLDVYLDMVEHQRNGEQKPFLFRYPGADGTAEKGRFPKDPSNFVPQVPHDPHLGGPVADDFPFGRELAPINGLPHRYVFNNLIAAAAWLTRALDVQGYRLDDVKGLSTDFLRPFLETEPMAGKFSVGEFFDGNRVLVNGWIFNPTGMNGRSSAFDFPLKFVLNEMCNNAGRFDMSQLDHVGLAGISPQKAVTFVENHDTDLNRGESIIFNKALGYAYILTSEGYPCVYYRDYDTGPDGFGLKPQIDNLIWIHEKLADGATQQRWKDFNVFAYERLGGPHLLVGLNNDPGGPRTITVATGFGPHVRIHDHSGHAPDAVTDRDGNVTITIPQNRNGLSYVCYSIEGRAGGFESTGHAVTQEFQGAADLDILPALGAKPVLAGRVWCAANTPITGSLKPETTGWTDATSVMLELLNPDGTILAGQRFTSHSTERTELHAVTRTEGFHAFRLTASSTPSVNPDPAYTLSVTYTGPATFDQTKVAPFEPAVRNPAEVGQWSEKISLPNVPIHTHMLPTGKVLFWGRRNPSATADFPSLNQHETHAFIWDPATPHAAARPTRNAPVDLRGNPINLFCSGHTFLADGRLLVTGGHIFDSQGLNTSAFYDPFEDQWSAGPTMNNGRWYPTVVTLPDGKAFVSSGSFASGPLQPPKNDSNLNTVSQIFENGAWQDLTEFKNPPLFPRFHVTPSGALFMSGSNATTFLFEKFQNTPGNWVPVGTRSVDNADYAPSVMFDEGKVVYIGGGSTTNVVEVIDLNVAQPAWARVAPMKFRRRQHNATLMPDGTVLVTGGSEGTGFNDLGNQAVRTPELWDPKTGIWTEMAPENVDRCYHSTAVLLPDGRVFSGGGGEYAPSINQSNPSADSHADAQLFSPPYLFKGRRPRISQAPDKVRYGQTFDVQTPDANDIAEVTWLRLGSVTHAFDQNQRINFLRFQARAHQLAVTAPPNGNVCPPGHYMLFILNRQKVPSEAAIIQITAAAESPVSGRALTAAASARREPAPTVPTPAEQDAAIQKQEKRPPVVVGVTPTCPYGLSACWGGAYEALSRLHGVRLVRPVPNAKDSTAYVYLHHNGLPDLDLWPTQFAKVANGSHLFRGVEITVEGVLELRPLNVLLMRGNDQSPPLLLEPIEPSAKVQWDAASATTKPLEASEQGAYQRLLDSAKAASGSIRVAVTGPLRKAGNEYVLEVRQFAVAPEAGSSAPHE